MNLKNWTAICLVLLMSIESHAKISSQQQLEMCDLIVTKCEEAINQKDYTIKLLEEEVDLLKKTKKKSNWLTYLLGGLVTGLVVGNVTKN